MLTMICVRPRAPRAFTARAISAVSGATASSDSNDGNSPETGGSAIRTAGVFVEQGPPSEVFFNPKDERTKRFLRHVLPEQEPQHAAELGIAAPGDEEDREEEVMPLPGTSPQPPAMGTYLPNPNEPEEHREP